MVTKQPMKILTVYESTDGSRWDKREDAEKRDALNHAVTMIEMCLPAIPNDCDTRIAVDPTARDLAKKALVELCRIEHPEQDIFKHDPLIIHPMSFAGRFLNEVGGPLDRAWRWFCCERDGWLYQQPFYALNPGSFREKPNTNTP